MHYTDLLRPLLVNCEYGEIGTGSPLERVELHERQFDVRFPTQYRSFFLEVGWFYARAGRTEGLKVGIYGEGEGVDPYLWIEFNNPGLAEEDWIQFGDHRLWGKTVRDPSNVDVVYEDWFAFRRGGGEAMEPQVYRFRHYSSWITDDIKDKEVPGKEWLLAYPDFDAWLAATIAMFHKAAQE